MVVFVKTLPPQLNAKSLMWKVVLSDLDTVYYPRRIRKIYSTIIMSHLAWRMGSPDAFVIIKMCRNP